MTPCPAGKHDLDVVGRMAPDAGRTVGKCRGCRTDKQQARRRAVARAWEIPEGYDLDTGELIIDQVAIDRACNSGRVWFQTEVQPWITETEANIAAHIMVDRGYEPAIIADNIGCTENDVYRWILGADKAAVAA